MPIAALLWTFLAVAEDSTDVSPHDALVVVTNLENDTDELTRRELGRIFLKQTKYWSDGERCVPIDQPGTSDTRTRFYKMVLGRDPYEMQRYWMQETMTGNAKPPITLNNADTVKRYVQKIDGAIAYIRIEDVDESVKVLLVTDVPELNLLEEPKDDTESEETE